MKELKNEFGISLFFCMKRCIAQQTWVRCLTGLLFALCSISIFSQTSYPVHVNVQVLPPYGIYLRDYYSGTRDKLIVTLLNRDQQQRTLQVKLRVRIKNGSQFSMQSRDELYYPMITLESGIPLRLTTTDIAAYLAPEKVNVQGYLKDGKLPTGMTEFSVQAVDYVTGRTLSPYATGRAWLEIKRPPMLNLPLKDEQIAYRDPQHIRFQWMPQHQGLANTMYEFVLKLLPDNGAAPQSAFAYGQEVYRTQTRFTTLNYTHLEPMLMPGSRYAWQVRAIAKDGPDEIGMFDNNGYSEIGWFELNDNCPAPTNLTAKGGYRKMTLEWKSVPEQRAFYVEYRPKSSQNFYDWTSTRTYDTSHTVLQLNPGWTYEYRVGAICMKDKPVYSPVQEITLSMDNEARMQQCGVAPKIDLSNQTPKEDLKVGDIIIAGGDFPLTITELSSQGNGWYSGKGWITLTWIFETNIAVKFNRLRVNTDNRQIGGVAESETDPKAAQIANTNRLDYGGSNTTAGKVEFAVKKVEFTVPDTPVAQYDPEKEELIVFDTEGKPHVIETQKNEGESIFPMVIEDEQGNKYQIDAPPADDTSMQPGSDGTGSNGKQQPVISKIEDAPSGFDPDKLSTDAGFSVRYLPGNGKYAFDAGKEPWYQTAQLIKEHYPRLENDYIAPWKLIPVGENDVVEAVVVGSGADKDKIKFVLKDGNGLPAREENGKWIISLPSVKAGQTYEVFAVYEAKKGKPQTVGKLNVVSYPRQKQTVTLVPVDGASPDVSWLETQLNNIFAPYGVTITVKVDDSLKGNTEWDLDGDGALNLNGSGFFSKETDEMKALRKLYQKTSPKYDRNAYYIFLSQRAKASEEPDAGLAVQGDMPRGKQFGYIFMQNSADTPRLIAHELGHGMFTLLHSFDINYSGDKFKSATTNLMDYNNGTELAVWQWNIMANPAPLTWFDSEDDSKAVLEPDTKAIARLLRTINCALSRNEKEIQLFVPKSSLSSTISSLVSELNLAGSNCPDAKLSVTLQDIYGEVKDFGNDYLADEFSLSNIQYIENKTILLTGKKYKLLFSSQKETTCVYSFVKSTFVGKLTSKTPINLTSFDKLQYASLCELEQLTISNRTQLLQKASQETNWYNSSLKDSRQKTGIQLIISTPDEDQPKLLQFLHANSTLIEALYNGIDDYRDELAYALFNLFVRNQQALKDIKTVSFALPPGITALPKKEFSDYFWGWLYLRKQQTTAEFTGSKRIEVKSKQYQGMSIALTSIFKEGEKQFEGRPFDVVQLIDPKDYTSIELPLILYKYAADESSQENIFKDFEATGKKSLDLAMLLMGLKSFSGFSTALMTEVTAQNVARLILGSADLLTLGLGNVCEDSNSDFCKAYKEYELLINCGLLSASVLNEFPQIYNGLKKGLDNPALSSVQKQKLKEVLGVTNAGAHLDDIYNVQKAKVSQWKNAIANESNKYKGNFGEMASDVFLAEKGYIPLHTRLSDIEAPIHQGIDGVFEKDGMYFIVEAKYKGTATLSTLADGTKQMSDDWIRGNDRLFNAVGKNEELTETIRKSSYKRLLAEVAPNGTVIYKELDANAKIIGIFTP